MQRRRQQAWQRDRVAAWLAAMLLPLALLIPCAPAATLDDAAVASGHGWDYLIEKLVADGVPRAQAAAAFADSRVPPFDGLAFALAPREASGPYRRLQSAASIRAARLCRTRHAEAFAAAEAREGVPASVVAAIVYVESACGRSTGSSYVLHRLARLAMARAPANLADNVRRHAGEPPDPAVAEQVRRRACYLEDTFYPEVRGLFTIAERSGVDPLSLRGSAAGAFGFPQFLPTSYLRYGVDGDGDGRVSLYDMADAAASCARYLAQRGWHAGLSIAEKRRVIWQYNRSDAYIDTILALESRLRDVPDASQQVAGATRRVRRR